MLEKIKALGESAKNAVLFVVGPLAFALGFIYYLMTENTDLREELKEHEGERKLDELKEKQKDVDNSAAHSVQSFEEFRGRFTNVPGSLGESNPSGEITGADQRPGVGSSRDPASVTEE